MQARAGIGIGTHNTYGARRWTAGIVSATDDAVAEEVPVALVYNGISHAVMLATPLDLEDFGVGFSLSECIAGRPGEILDLEVVERDNGIEVRMELPGERFHALKDYRRRMAGRTGCGLCGTESLEQLARHNATVRSSASVTPGALVHALQRLADHQHLFRLTGAVHAAAWCGADGGIELLREDVGRHNAFDKLVGALASAGRKVDDGFVLMTSRASYEIVQKAAAAGIGVLAAVSAPTGLAIRVAERAGVTLIGFARGERHSVYSHPQRVLH